ncbi:MAG: trans-2-enoyl-CoA reductase family protein [Opitutales bacterium]|nr:trans-2-enoyl-CoA reductase family protein [Opitutales bacterium]
MIIKPKTRGFICTTAHPEGCKHNVREQIDYVRAAGIINDGPKNVLIIGSSTGYGLASRIVAAFGCKAKTVGVFFERPASGDKTASAGWYNSVAFKQYAESAGLVAENINGDAFSTDIKDKVLRVVKDKLGKVDCLIYSLAAPRRTDPLTGETYRSVLKPIGEKFSSKTVNVDTNEVYNIELEPATPEEITGTIKVMGGEDWELWIQALLDEGLLADGAKTVAYSYLGPQMTKPIYSHGTIGKAKEDLDRAVISINDMLSKINGHACISVNKAVVTQASSAIPVVPLYISLLFKVMKEKNVHEGCIEQMYRLFKNHLYGTDESVDEVGRVHLDNFEMQPDVQAAVLELWSKVNTEDIVQTSDIIGYRKEFLKLFGFGIDGINYNLDVTP